MSATVNIAGGISGRSGVMYALYGRGGQYVEHMKNGTNRAVAYASSMGSPEEFIAYAEEMAAAHGRRYETYNLVLAGDPKVFDVRDPEDIKKMLGLSVGLAEAAYSAEYLVVIHGDAKGEHVHGHIYVVNHDECTGKALKKNTSWKRGLHQLNDELLVEAGYDPNPDPARPKPDWELRREEFKPGGFEQTLGDLVYESLADPRSTNRENFEQVLDEHGLRLKVTDRDGWTYSMRREDNGKWGRKKASALTPEFTADGAEPIFDYHAQKGATHGLLDTMKADDEQRSTMETLAELTSRLPAVEQQLTKLTKTVADLTGFVKVMDEQQDRRMTRLSTSRQPEQPSTLPLDDETRNRLSEIEKTLAAVAAQLSSSEAVKLPDGSSVKRSDLDAHSMMTRIENQLATTTASSSELAEAVKRRGRVVIDTDKLTAHAITVLDDRLARAVEPVAERVEQGLVGFEQKVASVGSTQVEEAMRQLAAVEDKADKVVKAVRSAEGLVETLSARVTWTAVGRLALALLPLAAVLLMIGGLVGGVAYAAGFGPLLGWAWGSFTAADVWWVKALIAVGTLAGVATFGWVVWQLALKLGDDFRHW